MNINSRDIKTELYRSSCRCCARRNATDLKNKIAKFKETVQPNSAGKFKFKY